MITQDTHRDPLTHPHKLSTQTSCTHCIHTHAHMASAHANTPKGKSDGVVKALQVPPESLSSSCILSQFSHAERERERGGGRKGERGRGREKERDVVPSDMVD